MLSVVSWLNYCRSSGWELPAHCWRLQMPSGYLPLPPWPSFPFPVPTFIPYLTSRRQQVWLDYHLPVYHS